MKMEIVDAFHKQVITNNSSAPVFTIEFNLHWDILAFMRDEYPEEGERARLGDVITLTQHSIYNQALTCAEYMEQTWPCTGAQLLAVVQEAVDAQESPSGSAIARELSDRTRVSAKISQKSFTLVADGTLDAIGEIAQQIAWLGSALRSGNDREGRPMQCTPSIKRILGKLRPRDKTTESYSRTVYLHFEIKSDKARLGPFGSNGSCWKSMFRSPVVVMGYPVRQRPRNWPGLEIPLHMMAGLVRSRSVNEFLGRWYIKGFSSMLVAVGHGDDVYIWHHLYNANGDRISYTDVDDAVIDIDNLSVHDLASARHIVGWCNKASYWAGEIVLLFPFLLFSFLFSSYLYFYFFLSFFFPSIFLLLVFFLFLSISLLIFPLPLLYLYYLANPNLLGHGCIAQSKRGADICCGIGSSQAKYDVKHSKLPPPSRDLALEKVSLSLGQTIITGGCTFGVSKKDTPIHVSKAGYIDKLRWISQKYVVFWDEDDKRGWMVDGSSALLHLVRGSLEHSRTDKFRSQFMFDFSKLRDRSTLEHDSPIDVLLDPEHRRLPVYPAREETYTETVTTAGGTTETVTKTKTTYKNFGNLVEELYECLEKMIDHKSMVENPKGFNPKARLLRLREHLEGWDFRDLTENRSPFDLRVATLRTGAFDWVDLTRSARAVTLFGRGFGELLTPAGDSNRAACSAWRSVPRGKYYLCVSVTDLQELMRDHNLGTEWKHGIVIAPGLAWMNPHRKSPFDQCPCEREGPQRSHRACSSPVQRIISTKLHVQTLMQGEALDLNECENGAVIFAGGWMWSDSGEPGDNSGVSAALDETVSASSSTGASAPQPSRSTFSPRPEAPISSSSVSSTAQTGSNAIRLGSSIPDTGSSSVVPSTDTLSADLSPITTTERGPDAHTSSTSSGEKRRSSLVQLASELPILRRFRRQSKGKMSGLGQPQ
jgi:hypothetical protein